MKKKKKNIKISKEELKDIIVKQKDTTWYPPVDATYHQVQTDSWFDIKIYNNINTPINLNININNDFENNYLIVKKISLFLTKEQKEILLDWLSSYTEMYNKTVEYVYKKLYETKRYVKSFHSLRKNLMDQKNEILEKSKHNNQSNYIRVHMLDGAINQVASNIQTCLTNLKRGNIKKFRLRPLKVGRKNRIMKIEKSFFLKGNQISGLGKIKATYQDRINGTINFDLDTIIYNYNKDCILKYDSELNEYYLFVPYEVERQVNNLNNYISLDPGLRKFLTGITENQVVMIGTNIKSKIEKSIIRIKQLEKLKNKFVKKCKIIKYKRKLENRINDFHWKIINYLTSNFKNIMIGNLSTKQIISKKSKIKFTGIYKQYAQKIQLYKFRERLRDKCNRKSNNYKMINEWLTSQSCSKCGNIDSTLGKKEIYDCCVCNLKMDRDVNSCRNILFKRHLV